jgi:hypothetical protein
LEVNIRFAATYVRILVLLSATFVDRLARVNSLRFEHLEKWRSGVASSRLMNRLFEDCRHSGEPESRDPSGTGLTIAPVEADAETHPMQGHTRTAGATTTIHQRCYATAAAATCTARNKTIHEIPIGGLWGINGVITAPQPAVLPASARCLVRQGRICWLRLR